MSRMKSLVPRMSTDAHADCGMKLHISLKVALVLVLVGVSRLTEVPVSTTCYVHQTTITLRPLMSMAHIEAHVVKVSTFCFKKIVIVTGTHHRGGEFNDKG